ncbi:uncharacterized protein LOC121777394 [Salvia splendens]|uniref:uncharacterized protein LOC121777394 n=1 Tax=Salvia splendens TaxID=180675 RepID=UPI001C2726A0|nr:uncharacterized protein LOC121777394 [Salvia splendens]
MYYQRERHPDLEFSDHCSLPPSSVVNPCFQPNNQEPAMDLGKKKTQSAKDYEVPDSKATALTPFPTTSQKQIVPNRFSPLQIRPEIPFKSMLASNSPKPTNIQIPNSPEQFQKYFTKDWFEDIGMTPHTEYPTGLIQKDFIRARFQNPTQLWESDNSLKDQRYYELILVDSHSVEITHNPSISNEISFSKCVIKKIHAITTFGGFKEFKDFSVRHPAKGFNYIDYKNAWFRTFFMRPFNHSWFFTFHSNIDKHFPMWFFDWWRKFGSNIQITPPSVQKGFQVFSENSNHSSYQKPLMFHAEFKVPWIFAWDFHFRKIYPDPTPFSLIRVFKIKWWSKFQENTYSEHAVRHYLSTGQKVTCQKGDVKKEKSKASSSSKVSKDSKFMNMPEDMKKEFLEFLAQRSSSTKTKSKESVSSDPIGGQDPYDFQDPYNF